MDAPVPPVCAWLAIACVVAGIARIAVTFSEVLGFHQVKQESRTDELTGLPNRRALLESAQEIVASSATGRPAALLLLDLDGFKEVNDSLGHTAGDELLRQVGPRRAVRCAPTTSSPASVATSSPSCCPTPGRSRRASSPSGCAFCSSSPSRSPACGCTSA